MASASKWEAKFISHKLTFLKDQEDVLIGAVRQYVSGIIAAGESWTEGGDNQAEYVEISHMIDTAIGFVCEKCKELDDETEGIAANKLSRPSYIEPATLLASTITPPSKATEPVQPADDTQLKPVLARIAVIEEAVISFRSNADKLSQVIQEVAVMSRRLQQLEVKSSRTRCGFTAWAQFTGLDFGRNIKSYKTLDCNVGGNFNGDSGVFTAPVDGLYVTSISLCVSDNRKVEVSVKCNKEGQSYGTNVCVCLTEVKETTACGVGVVDMKAGDTLYSYMGQNMTNHHTLIYFSGFLLA